MHRDKEAQHIPVLKLERIAFIGLLIAVFALSLIRISITDSPWHLATAKYAFTNGYWPVSNTFSYTYPDYPPYQQYPIYQTVLYAVFLAGGWEGLSILHFVLWTLIFVLWIRWGGPCT